MNDGARAAVSAIVALAALLTGSCVVGPDFKRPAPPGVDGYLPPAEAPTRPPPPQAAANGVNGVNGANPASAGVTKQRVALGEEIPAAWWELFHCARLDETLRQAIAASNSLAAARATLAQAQHHTSPVRWQALQHHVPAVES